MFRLDFVKNEYGLFGDTEYDLILLFAFVNIGIMLLRMYPMRTKSG